MCGGVITSSRQKVDISRGQYLMKNIEIPLTFQYIICPRTGRGKGLGSRLWGMLYKLAAIYSSMIHDYGHLDNSLIPRPYFRVWT